MQCLPKNAILYSTWDRAFELSNRLSHPYNMVSSVNWLRVHSSRSLVKILNRTHPGTERWRAAFVTTGPLDLAPSTFSLGSGPKSHFFSLAKSLFIQTVSRYSNELDFSANHNTKYLCMFCQTPASQATDNLWTLFFSADKPLFLLKESHIIFVGLF